MQRLPSETRLLELDGLRGVAILMVLVCHYWFGPDIAQASPSSLHVFGFRIFASGVDLFFVLSGFLIGGILLDRRDSPAYFRVFYARRMVRIFPVYYGFLLLTAVLGVVLHAQHKPTPVFDAGTPYWMFVLFLQNFSLAWFGDSGWITVTMAWSLALEEQFYLTLPAAVKKLNTRVVIGISVLIIVIAPVVRSLFADTPHSFGSLVLAAIRIDALVAGFLCAVFVRSRFSFSSIQLVMAAICLAALVAVTHVAASPVAFLRETSLLGLYCSILLLAVQGSLRFLQLSVLRFLGTISYTLYLVHQSALLCCCTMSSATRFLRPSAEGLFLHPLRPWRYRSLRAGCRGYTLKSQCLPGRGAGSVTNGWADRFRITDVWILEGATTGRMAGEMNPTLHTCSEWIIPHLRPAVQSALSCF